MVSGGLPAGCRLHASRVKSSHSSRGKTFPRVPKAMSTHIASPDDVKVLGKPADSLLPTHCGRVATHEADLADLEEVPCVELVGVLVARNRPLVFDRLPVVLAQRLEQPWEERGRARERVSVCVREGESERGTANERETEREKHMTLRRLRQAPQ